MSELEGSNLAKGKLNGNSWEMKGKKTWDNEFYNLKINKYGSSIFFRNFPCRNNFNPIKAYKILVP